MIGIEHSIPELQRQLASVQRQLTRLAERVTALESPRPALAIVPPDDEPTEPHQIVPPWLAVMHAHLGLRETPGPGVTPWIAQCLALVGLPNHDDSTAWCSAAIAGAMAGSGVSLACPVTAITPRGRVTAAARSWTAWGQPLAELRVGAVVVLSRGANPALGHVGLVLEWTADQLRIIGGNQSNKISEIWVDRARIVSGGVRWPA